MRYVTGPSNERGGKHRGVEGRHLCLGCQAHRARFRYRGQVRADRDHTLCFRCFRAEVNRLRARRMAAPLLGGDGRTLYRVDLARVTHGC